MFRMIQVGWKTHSRVVCVETLVKFNVPIRCDPLQEHLFLITKDLSLFDLFVSREKLEGAIQSRLLTWGRDLRIARSSHLETMCVVCLIIQRCLWWFSRVQNFLAFWIVNVIELVLYWFKVLRDRFLLPRAALISIFGLFKLRTFKVVSALPR